jgi:hypothetical protein
MSPSIKRIKRQLMADKKKLGMLMTLMALGLLLWGRLLLQPVPRTAVADPKTIALAAPAPMSTEPVIHHTARRTVHASLKSSVDRDLFAIRSELFPRTEGQDIPETGKSQTQTSDDSQHQSRAIEAQAKALKLQSTLLGNRPRALINGVLLEVGQTIAGFEVIQIAPRQVTIRKNDTLIQLEM